MVERNAEAASLFDVIERVIGRGIVVAREGRRAIDLLQARLIVVARDVADPELFSEGAPGPRPPGPPAGG